jgi:hypothetical protein
MRTPIRAADICSAFNCYKLGSALFLLSAPVLNSGQQRTVWQVGIFNQSPLEFSSKPREEIKFEVGKDDSRIRWSSFQAPRHPYAVIFTLPSPQGLYSLKISLLIVQPRIPVMRIDVNGHAGNFYLRPKLSYFPGDVESSYHENNSIAELDVKIPPGFLHPGSNVITLNCQNDPDSSPEEASSSGIAYDAIALLHDASANYEPGELSATVDSTIFFRQRASGLVEIVDAILRFGTATPRILAVLELGGKRYEARIPAVQQFGERKVSFEIPDTEVAVEGKLHVGSQSFDVRLTPRRKWTVFIVPHTHLDIGFTDYQGKVAETQSRVLSQAADLIRQHSDFRFSMDGSWNLQQLLETRPTRRQDQILDLIRKGKMGMPVQYCNLLTGYASLETLYRSLYKSKIISREHNLPFEYANITDVPTYSGAYPSVLADSGVKYWAAAANNYRAPLLYHEHWNEKSPFWWEGPDGKKVLFWYSWAYLQVQTVFGLPPNLDAVRESLPVFLQAYSQPSYQPDAVMMYGTQVENTDLFPSTATFVSDWNRSYAYPKLVYATFPEFFQYVEQRYGTTLPTYKVDGGPYWEDGIGSDAFYAAEDRHNQARALSAEVLSTANYVLDQNLSPPQGIFDDIWQNIILFAEHTWLSFNSVVQPDHEQSVRQLRVKDGRAEQASLEIDDVMNRSLSQLADLIHISADTLVIFNSLNWKRDSLVETDIPPNSKLTDLTTRQDVLFEVLDENQGFLHIRFLAKDLPPVGYKCIKIESDGQRRPEQPPASGETIENSFYRITASSATGALESIYDKPLGRELVNKSSPYKFGQYVYVTGGDRKTEAGTWQTVLAYGGTQIIKSFLTLPKAELQTHLGAGVSTDEERQPWGSSLRLRSSGLNTPKIDTEVLLFNGAKKVELRVRLHKNFTTDKEAVYLAFPIAVARPSFAYGSQQGWLNPAKDLMKGASLEWFTIQSWMAAYDDDLAVGIVPVEAPLATFGDINRGNWPARFEPHSGTMFSYLMNNYWDTNYRAGQSGDFEFRYVLTSDARLNGASLTHLGTEERRPIELNHVTSQDKPGDPPRPLPAEGTQFLETDGEGISLVTWKKAEDGRGTILRLLETTGKPTDAVVRFPHAKISSAELCSGVEDACRPLPAGKDAIRLSFKRFEVRTVRVIFSL